MTENKHVSVTIDAQKRACFKQSCSKITTNKTAVIVLLTVIILTSFVFIFWKYFFIFSYLFGGHHRKAPYQAFLRNNKDDICSGVLISSEFIITAAHCVFNTKEVSIILGVDKIDDINSPKRMALKSSEFIIHHNYVPETLINDLALVKIPSIPLSSSHVDVAPLPLSNKQREYSGELVKSFGWAHPDLSQGLYDSLQEKNMVVLNAFYCDSEFDNNSQLCLFGYGDKKVCTGDSGGPILSDDDDGSVLIGVVSKGGEDCREGRPVVGVKLDYYVEWIEFQIYLKMNSVVE